MCGIGRIAMRGIGRIAMRPYGVAIIQNHYNGVEMIRHDLEFIQRDFGADGRRFYPFHARDFPIII